MLMPFSSPYPGSGIGYFGGHHAYCDAMEDFTRPQHQKPQLSERTHENKKPFLDNVVQWFVCIGFSYWTLLKYQYSQSQQA